MQGQKSSFRKHQVKEQDTKISWACFLTTPASMEVRPPSSRIQGSQIVGSFLVYDFPYEASENRSFNKIVFFNWYVSAIFADLALRRQVLT